MPQPGNLGRPIVEPGQRHSSSGAFGSHRFYGYATIAFNWRLDTRGQSPGARLRAEVPSSGQTMALCRLLVAVSPKCRVPRIRF